MIRILLALIVMIVFLGCVPKPHAQPVQSEISLALPQYVSRKTKELPISLKVQAPKGISIESDKLFYLNQNGTKHSYAYHRWEGSLARQLHERLVLAFAQRGSFKDVARQGEIVKADWILESEVLDFAQWMQSKEKATIKFTARMRLIEFSSRENIGNIVVHYEVPMETLDTQSAIKAYNMVLKMWFDETIKWIEKIGDEKYAL